MTSVKTPPRRIGVRSRAPCTPSESVSKTVDPLPYGQGRFGLADMCATVKRGRPERDELMFEHSTCKKRVVMVSHRCECGNTWIDPLWISACGLCSAKQKW